MSNFEFQPFPREDASDVSSISTTEHQSRSPPVNITSYQRMPSQSSIEFAANNPLVVSMVEEPENERTSMGWGISGRRPMSINRKPVGNSLSPPIPEAATADPPFFASPAGAEDLVLEPFTHFESAKTSPSIVQTPPGSSKPLISPRFQRFDSTRSQYGGAGYGSGGLETMREEDDIARGRATTYDEHEVRQGDERISMNNDNDDEVLLCPAHKDIHSSRASWVSISILMLSIYSTVFSGIWLVLAIVQPRYGRAIHSGGKITPVTASTLFALFAKTIELSFVTVFVTFLGQVLTRRSLVQSSRGVNIAELSMRTWVLQPGFMITHWQHLQHAALSILGAITLTAAVVSMFYTTASDSLVSPHLRYGKPESTVMFGLVSASFANPKYIGEQCHTPISSSIDQNYSKSTCMAIENAGQSYHNSLAYLTSWEKISVGGVGASSDLSSRPQPSAILYDNTTVTGSWIKSESSNIVNDSVYSSDRVINNITMSMPHAGVFATARDSRNGILQPEDLAGVGEYNLQAAVISPTLNVLCVNMNYTELAPLIYVEWPNAIYNISDDGTRQKQAWLGWEYSTSEAFRENPFLNSTVVDDIFQWGPSYGLTGRYPPVFPMVPIDYNTLVNISVFESDSNYLLLKSAATPDYTMCQIRGWASTSCSTSYDLSGASGGSLATNCDASNPMAYSNSVSPIPPIPLASGDYRNVASQWLQSTSLGTGITNANASSGRLLSQLALTTNGLPPLTPSLAEMLAVMGGSTLLLSTIDSTYLHYWNYTSTVLNPGVYESFNASLASQQYTSGPVSHWQGMFYIVLALVFITNVFCLVYFFLRSGLVTDYTEPQNLFALAVNSPPSRRLGGACGGGPQGGMLNVDWHVGQEEGTNHYYFKEVKQDDGSVVKEVEGEGLGLGLEEGNMEMRKRRSTQTLKSITNYRKLSTQNASWL